VFTGIVEEVGVVEKVSVLGNGRAFHISARQVLDGAKLGDSISIDGACHTVTALHEDSFEIQSVATTLERTTVGTFAPGRRVNLERAMALGDRLGGHMVQGHVDAVGEVTRIEHRGEHVLIDFTLPDLVAAVTILHGSITVNGVSLTVNALPAANTCQVSLIPHTWKVTALADLEVGQGVNLEGDLIGKYVRQLLGAPGGSADHKSAAHLRNGWGY
jgi:riboflavin synthase